MTTLRNHAANQPHPEGFDSIDFYVRNGHRLHARAMRESLRSVVDLLRDFGRRRRRARIIQRASQERCSVAWPR